MVILSLFSSHFQFFFDGTFSLLALQAMEVEGQLEEGTPSVWADESQNIPEVGRFEKRQSWRRETNVPQKK